MPGPATVVVQGPKGERFKFNQEDAARYVASHPGSSIVGGGAEAKAVQAAPENKAVGGPAERK